MSTSDKNEQNAERKRKFEQMRVGMEEMRRCAQGGMPGDAPASSAPPSAEGREYVVRPGDSLSAIARAFYGDARRWPEIYEANKGVIGANPDIIHTGQKLHLP